MQEDAYDEVSLPEKLYFKIGEVSTIVGVPAYVLRFWETEFRQINPRRTESGQRLYRRQDVVLILRIKALLHDRRFTIEGARQHLRQGKRRPEPASKPKEDTSSIEEIADIRAELIRIREIIDSARR